MSIDRISIRGARQHNLKNLSVDIPRQSLTVITGLSGSGKSSLAFDTIYAEGQRRYVETLSAYARQFLDQMERPDVDSIDGLSPAIAIEQKTTSRSPRSTVGTITEIYDYLRLLWSSIGVPHCPRCGREIARQSAEQMVQNVMGLMGAAGESVRVLLLAPIVRGRKGEFRKELEKLRKDGFLKVRVDGEMLNLDEDDIRLDKRRNHTIDVVIDRLLLRPNLESRLEASITTAMRLANGLVTVGIIGGEERLYSEKLACPDCGISVPQLEPRSFSFNSMYGACEACHGLGSHYEFDPGKVILDWGKPLLDGGLGPGSATAALQRQLRAFATSRHIDLDCPFGDLTEKQQEDLLRGHGTRNGFHGILGFLQGVLDETTVDSYRDALLEYTSPAPCPACQGQRLRPDGLAVKVGGLSIAEFTALPVEQAAQQVRQWTLTARDTAVAGRIVTEISERLGFLLEVGLGYMSLDRPASTLSGGEAQRIRLAGQIGSRLRGVLYVLDEPSIGLHPRDNTRLLSALEQLRDLGNTVLVVEHDQETIERADYVLDLGPGAGRSGGELVAAGTPPEIIGYPRSLTGQYLGGQRSIPVPAQRRPVQMDQGLRIVGAREHNLKNVDVFIPAGVLTVVTGVSGAGKSTLINDILYPAMAQRLYRSRVPVGEFDELRGADLFDKIIRIDQDPIGRTPRSNPATYTGVFSPIRDLYAMLPESRERGYKPGRFSFNVRGGRCEACQGEGQRRIEMNFLPDVYVNCEVCRGRRYNQETLAVRYKGLSIADLLESTIEDTLEVMQNVPSVKQKLQTLVDVGLGYLHLGQAATTLSGGEAQRIKLARELSRRQTGRTLYLLDEPTTGLHFEDVNRLLQVLGRLVDLGNTVLIVEHHLDVVKTADWVVDLGPEGGMEGGWIVAAGTPEEVAACPTSHTGQALRAVLG